MEQVGSIYLKDARSWREWLENNYETVPGIWLIYFKKHTGKPRVGYNEAVEEALCFGWIDSVVKRIDDETYMQKFSPRKARSGWSASNVKRVEKLIGEGKMMPAGLKAVEMAKANGKWDEALAEKVMYALSTDFLELLQQNNFAFMNYKKLSPSHKRQYANWVMSAKRPETRLKRCREMIRMLEKNEKLGMK